MATLTLSPLGHTWILDLDGTLVKHNGYLTDGCDTFLAGAEAFLRAIPESDMVVFITARTEQYRDITEQFFSDHRVRYDHIIFNAPSGERILINDQKPLGLSTAIAINFERNIFSPLEICVAHKS
jgi:hypothetical protein